MSRTNQPRIFTGLLLASLTMLLVPTAGCNNQELEQLRQQAYERQQADRRQAEVATRAAAEAERRRSLEAEEARRAALMQAPAQAVPTPAPGGRGCMGTCIVSNGRCEAACTGPEGDSCRAACAMDHMECICRCHPTHQMCRP